MLHWQLSKDFVFKKKKKTFIVNYKKHAFKQNIYNLFYIYFYFLLKFELNS